MNVLPVFSNQEFQRAKLLLAAKVASMMGRKLEEGDWSEVYCKAKDIPDHGWSNLHIDINHNGLGVEFKMLRISQPRGRSIMSVCGTTRMHPAATRSIRIDNVNLPANRVMHEVLHQYSDLIEARSKRVKENGPDGSADLRFGWLLWEGELIEFLYFEEPMTKPDPSHYYAIWNETAARGARKASRSLWIFERDTGVKRYSVTTSAGIKIQPYFDVPAPTTPNLSYFRVQSEPVDEDTIILWVAAATAGRLRACLGSIDKRTVSDAVVRASRNKRPDGKTDSDTNHVAVPIPVSRAAFGLLLEQWDAVSDEHRIQQVIEALES